MFNGITPFYNGVATQSLRMDYGSNPNLNITNSGAPTLNTKGTLSFWYKRGIQGSGTGQHQYMIHTGTGTADNTHMDLKIETGNVLSIGAYGTTPFAGTRLLRDASAWYHIVVAFDSTSGTASARLIKVYVNSVVQTGTFGAVAQNQQFPWINASQAIYIGRHASVNRPMDGYLAEWNLVDGQALTPDSFGETKNGVWIPISYSGSYGDNGARLQFNQVGVGTASTSTIGADTSGNTNHWTSSGIAAADCNIPDSPENNFATMNPLQISNNDSNFFPSEGNLKLTVANNSGYRNCSGTFSPMGLKGYFEFLVTGTVNFILGIIEDTTYPTNQDYADNSHQGVLLTDGGVVRDTASAIRSASDHNLGTIAVDEVLGVAFDFTGTNRNLWFHRANTYGTASGGVGNPATGANPIATSSNFDSSGDFRFHFGTNTGGAATGLHLNFGQNPSFNGEITAGTETDGNGIGVFKYEPPSGFLALCTANLPEPTIGSNADTQSDDHFNTVLWTGGSGDVAVSGVGFKPDWVWMKSRNNAQNHSVGDSSRGGTKLLSTSRNVADQTIDELHFTSDGFTSNTDWHTNNYTYVAWNWKANGGTATATINESGNNPAAVVQANPTAGFSLITYTGTGALGTIAHGLDTAPKMMIIKNRDATDAWNVFHNAKGNTHASYLNLSQAPDDNTSFWNDTSPTSSVFTINTDHGVNADGEKYVAYVFADVEGYSKFGGYTGNGNADGSMIFTNFSPSFVMIKRTNGTGSWNMADSKRSPNNVVAEQVQANLNNAESTAFSFDFLSNGFKARTTDAARNGDDDTYIYMAFAEAPFKYANAR